MKNKLCHGLLLLITLSMTANASEKCFGDYPYRVCTNTYKDSNGNTHIYSYDSDGNSYSVNTKKKKLKNRGVEITSKDSEGNSYSVRTWTDSKGVHSRDSEGNECTITLTGQVIGCQ